VGYGRKALALSACPSGLDFIGRQIKPGKPPQWRQRQRRDGGNRCAPPQFLLRHGIAPQTRAMYLPNRLDNCARSNFHGVLKIYRFRFLMHGQNLRAVPIVAAR
jgi:hypothetical protein